MKQLVPLEEEKNEKNKSRKKNKTEKNKKKKKRRKEKRRKKQYSSLTRKKTEPSKRIKPHTYDTPLCACVRSGYQHEE